MTNDERNAFEELQAQMNVIWLVVPRLVAILPAREREGVLAMLEQFRQLSAGAPPGMSTRTAGMIALQSEIFDRFIREVPGPARSDERS